MLFNSYSFIFMFFPLTLCLHRVLQPVGALAQQTLLLLVSWLFYAWWDVRFLPLLLLSIATNFLCGHAIANGVRQGRSRGADLILAIGIACNVLVIGVFKYAEFFLDNVDALLGTDFVIRMIILPLGISFFTFEQIAFLVDVRRGQATPADPLRYALFVSFFPRLVAGPILRYNEIVPQLTDDRRGGPRGEDVMVGMTIFFIGLIKKVVLADGISVYASPVFSAAQAGEEIDFFLAWGGALAYTCQLYFDFSGYSDMAIGAARCFGIRFPMNFFSPYKATSIIEFWRRWHITLSRFLRDYLYFALGGNRHGPARRYLNLMLTMLLGGLWHGANWTFIFWGGLHGLYLALNHAWNGFSKRHAPLVAFQQSKAGTLSGFLLTFVAVVIAWVFFRSPDFATAINILSGMAGFHGAHIPSGLSFALEPIQGLVSGLGITYSDGSGSQLVGTYLWLVGLLAIIFFAPNTQEIMVHYQPVLEMQSGKVPDTFWHAGGRAPRLKWQPSWAWAMATGAIAFIGTISITRVSEFLYWQF